MIGETFTVATKDGCVRKILGYPTREIERKRKTNTNTNTNTNTDTDKRLQRIVDKP